MEYIPYKKGDTVYIHNFRIIRKAKHVYLVYKADKLIANCFYKKSAFAVVNRMVNNQVYEDVLEHDKRLEKNYNDSIFYMNTITNTKNLVKFDIASVRLDISKSKIEQHLNAIADAATWHY